MTKLVVSAALLMLAGCANWEAHQASEESRYIGKPVDALYDEYGVPVGVAPTSDGGRFFEFRRYRGQFLCTAKVTTNAADKITKISTGGQNGCITPL